MIQTIHFDQCHTHLMKSVLQNKIQNSTNKKGQFIKTKIKIIYIYIIDCFKLNIARDFILQKIFFARSCVKMQRE